MPSRFAVVLAGGRSSRFGTDKLAADVGGAGALLDVVLAGLPADVSVVVVGSPRRLRRQPHFVTEEPRGGGPAAAFIAGVAAAVRAGAEEVVVLPGDAPAAGLSAAPLLAALAAGASAAVGVDATGLHQPLQVAMRRAAALDLLDQVGPDGAAHRSARSLLAALDPVPVPLPPGLTWDVDTPAQLAAWLVRDSPAVRAVLDAVEAVVPPNVAGVFALDGRSGAGKSTLALAAASHCGAVVVQGDLVGVTQGLRRLVHAGHEPVVFQILDPEELAFDFNGLLRLDGLEGSGMQKIDARAIREAYREEIQKHQRELSRQASLLSIDVVTVSTADSLDAVLSTYLARRSARARGGRR